MKSIVDDFAAIRSRQAELEGSTAPAGTKIESLYKSYLERQGAVDAHMQRYRGVTREQEKAEGLDDRFNSLVSAVSDIAAQIIREEATTMDDLRRKLHVAALMGWGRRYEMTPETAYQEDEHTPSWPLDDRVALETLWADVERLSNGGAA